VLLYEAHYTPQTPKCSQCSIYCTEIASRYGIFSAIFLEKLKYYEKKTTNIHGVFNTTEVWAEMAGCSRRKFIELRKILIENDFMKVAQPRLYKWDRTFFSSLNKEKYQKIIDENPFTYVRIGTKLMQDVGVKTAAVVSQLFYWSNRKNGDDPYVYKSYEELSNELGLSFGDVQNALKRSRKLGLISSKRTRDRNGYIVAADTVAQYFNAVSPPPVCDVADCKNRKSCNMNKRTHVVHEKNSLTHISAPSLIDSKTTTKTTTKTTDRTFKKRPPSCDLKKNTEVVQMNDQQINQQYEQQTLFVSTETEKKKKPELRLLKDNEQRKIQKMIFEFAEEEYKKDYVINNSLIKNTIYPKLKEFAAKKYHNRFELFECVYKLLREKRNGDVYSRLIERFASDAGKKAGEFHTPHKVSELIAGLCQPKVGCRICDPVCGFVQNVCIVFV